MSSEKKLNTVPKYILAIIIVSICTTITLTVISLNYRFKYDSASKVVEKYKDEASRYLQEVQKLNKTVTESISNFTECENEMTALSTRLEGIKDASDLLKRDIFLYIDKKYQIIPKTVTMKIAEQIIIHSKEENVSAELIIGIISVESAFNPMAISKKNARGLMQVMPEWTKKFKLKKVTDLHDIDTNIQCGTKVLKIHTKEAKGSITKGLYYYSGKSESYPSKVYEAMGKFVAFRSTLEDDDEDVITGKPENMEDVSK